MFKVNPQVQGCQPYFLPDLANTQTTFGKYLDCYDSKGLTSRLNGITKQGINTEHVCISTMKLNGTQLLQ